MGRSEELFEQAVQVLPGGVNSPVRAYRAVGMAPRFITRADGPYIWDEDGKKYIDYVCSWGPMILGHNHPVIREAVEKAVKDGLSFGAPTRREVEIARLMIDLVPNIEMVRMIYHLLREKGMTISGARQKLKDNPKNTVNNYDIISKLQNIKKELSDIAAELNG